MIEVTPDTAPAAPTGGFVRPSVGADGQKLTARQAFEILKGNPAYAPQATTPGTQAWEIQQGLDRDMAAETDAAGDPAHHFAEKNRPAQSDVEYQFPPLPPGLHADPEVLALESSARSWLQAAGFDARMGTSLASHVDELSRKAEGWDDAAFARHEDESDRVLLSIYGDALEAKLHATREFIDAVDKERPGLRQFLDDNDYLFADAMFVNFLIQAAEQRAARK